MMQILYPLTRYYNGLKIDETVYSKIAFERKEKLNLFSKIITDGCSEEIALEAIKLSRATYFRLKKRDKESGFAGLEPKSRIPKNVRKPQWDKATEDLVCQIRNTRFFRVWGKEKIKALLAREYNIIVSISTVGRILSKLLKQQRIRPVAWYTGKYIPRKRILNDHAQRLPVGAKSKKPGELIEVDHMTVKLDSGRW